jgi:Fe-S-cluster-containing dehydrogenase component/anaerobic selenocysteine-containing dehydrogenase
VSSQNIPRGPRERRLLPLSSEREPAIRPRSSLAALDGEAAGATASAAIDRRDLFKLLGAGMALAGVGGCNEPIMGEILPYVEQPPEVTPGLPVEYATSMVLDGFATGLLVQSREGRPIKIEGNPDHPASLGSTGVLEQAAVLSLYDPDRARSPLERGLPRSWFDFFAAMTGLEAQGGQGGQGGLRFLLPPQSSLLVAELIQRIQVRHPGAGFTFYEPLERRPVYEGARRAFGRPLEAQYDFQRADVVLSLDADFMASLPNSVRWSRDFAGRRRLSGPADEMSRLYVVETSFTPTGSIADHRLAIRASMVPQIAAGVFTALAGAGQGLRPAGVPDDVAGALASAMGRLDAGPHAAWIRAVARDLVGHAGRSLVLAGPRQPADVHVLVHAINAALGNLGRTVTFTEPALLDPLGASLGGLIADIRAGAVETLVMLEVNPVYTAPPELDFTGALRQVPRVVHLSLHHDETSPHCHWFLPAAHFLESWGDARSYDGTISFIQPLLRPLYGGRSALEVLAAFAGMPDAGGHALMQTFWLPRLPAAPSPQWHWERNLQRGLLEGSQLRPVPPVSDDALAMAWPEAAKAAAIAAARALGSSGAATAAPATPTPGAIELAFEPSPTVYDGRFANNAWLLELPQPLTQLTWDNAALISPSTAARLGVRTEDVVALARGDRRLQAPILVLPGHADDAITLHLGWGRSGSESLARDRGVNAYQLRTSDALSFAPDVALTRTGATYRLAATQGLGREHRQRHGREVALSATLSDYRAHPDFTSGARGPEATLLPQPPRAGNQWAMTIDTMICTGCSACVIACQAENNVPVVGKSGVQRGRQMHWLDIDTYFAGASEDSAHAPPAQPRAAEVVHQPMLCQHCEHAPCEYVCPVYATTHSPDGLNEMTYNRCIGTRFCSNNCPYKIRRFNWFEYSEGQGSRTLQHNPDVTVRERGVIEKCTFCVQRIRRAEMQVRMYDRELPAGAVMTACQQACPTGAIQFASLHHEDTPTVRWRREERAYAVLHELGTRPRVIYLAKITNPNPELAPATGAAGAAEPGGNRGA